MPVLEISRNLDPGGCHILLAYNAPHKPIGLIEDKRRTRITASPIDNGEALFYNMPVLETRRILDPEGCHIFVAYNATPINPSA